MAWAASASVTAILLSAIAVWVRWVIVDGETCTAATSYDSWCSEPGTADRVLLYGALPVALSVAGLLAGLRRRSVGLLVVAACLAVVGAVLAWQLTPDST